MARVFLPVISIEQMTTIRNPKLETGAATRMQNRSDETEFAGLLIHEKNQAKML
jgi:hypothetical protein